MNKQQFISPIGMMHEGIINTDKATQYAYEIKNLRLNSTEDGTQLIWTNEKQEQQLTPTDWPEGIHVLGSTTIKDTLIVFGKTSENDYILKLYYNNSTLNCFKLFEGNLNFDINSHIEALPFYENELIQKVYWIDGINQPRMINIAKDTLNKDANIYDFLQTLGDNPEFISVEKLNVAGLFPAGTVRYFITYSKQYGQETNIVGSSFLQYPIIGNRGVNPEGSEISSDSFKISVNYVNTTFDYINLYSVFKSTNNSTPIVKRVEQHKILEGDTLVTFIDNNSKGETVDYTYLYYVGGHEFIPKTIQQKDNTLFFSNYKLKQVSIPKETVDNLKSRVGEDLIFDYGQHSIPIQKDPIVYNYKNQLNNSSDKCKIFKYGEYYRVGVQFKNKYGSWSDVVFLKDMPNTLLPEITTNFIKTASLVYTIQQTEVDKLLADDYVKARLVVSYTTNSDRSFLAQGVLCPTVYNRRLHNSNAPYCQSSWYFRPIGDDLPYKNDELLHGAKEETCEIQHQISDRKDHIFTQDFLVNSNIVTFHSPELDFDESISNLINSNNFFKIIGVAPVTSFSSYAKIEGTKTTYGSSETPGYSYTSEKSVRVYTSNKGKSHRCSPGYWEGLDAYTYYNTSASTELFPIFPFQSKQLNNYYKKYTDTKDVISETIRTKVISNISHSLIPILKNTQLAVRILDITDCAFYFANNKNPLLLNINGEYKIYAADVDELIPSDSGRDIELFYKKSDSGAYTSLDSSLNYALYRYDNGIRTYIAENTGAALYRPEGYYVGTVGASSNPIPITYSSGNHLVVNLGTKEEEGEEKPIVLEDLVTKGYLYDPLNLLNPEDDFKNPYMVLVDLVRDVSDEVRFGGNSEAALLNTDWYPCSREVNLKTQSGYCKLHGVEGDHYLQRYDCLKTTPHSPDDINQIVEIFSFICETRINLDGRYDRNRGLLDNTHINETNFNKIALEYTQHDNYIVYKSLDQLASNLVSFPNQITWSKEKHPGELIDTWTNISMASTANADGTLGEITSIQNLGDKLVLFQEHGIAQIGFNEKTALSTTSGVPLEIANSGKFTGFGYISKHVGCQHPWSISNTKNGLMFIDASRDELNMLSNGIECISAKYGIGDIIRNHSNFRTFYDKLGKDIYYLTNDYCIAFNEVIGSFTSEYDYGEYNYKDITSMDTISNHTLFTKDGNLYALREGNGYKPYEMTIVANGSTSDGSMFTLDKVFNNIEYRLDGDAKGFDTVECNTPNQSSDECYLYPLRKFNTLRAQLPRALNSRDRLRGLWCKIKLSRNTNTRIQLYNFNVDFTVK